MPIADGARRWWGRRRAGRLAVVLLSAPAAPAARVAPAVHVALLALVAWLIWPPWLAAAQSLAGDPAGRDRWVFDLLPRVTDDPDLLTAREAYHRQKLLDLGVDPQGERRRPTLQTILARRMADAARLPLFETPRQVEILEVDARLGLISVYRFPETYPFYTSPDTNVVGVAFEPQRALADSTVQLSMHGQDGWLRTWRTIGFYDKWGDFFRQRKAAEASEGGLLNFTVPIRLPRTVERLIGRGDATNIRISGSETISIAGESTVRSNFLGSEVRQSQSLFPTLEMEQQLRVQLEGTVGEKIKVRVSHDSEAIGTTATEVKLAFEGDEDDIIQTIRAGNIDVTLPGSALLGVGAQRGGLFGIKIEGALGGLKFTALTSKEQSEQSKATFNSQGGTSAEERIANTDYVKNRYFRLTTSELGPIFFPADGTRPALQESPGYDPAQLTVDPNSIELFVTPANGTGIDILDRFPGYAFVDETGLGWEQEGVPFDPAVLPPEDTHAETADRWRRLSADEWELLKDSSNRTIGIVLDRSLANEEVLAAVYTLVDGSGTVVRRVGRSPSATPGTVDYPAGAAEPGQIYLFKLIKRRVPTTPRYESNAWQPLDLTWEYMFRNWYDLRGVDIDARSLEVRIEQYGIVSNNPDLDVQYSVPWLRVWGLDRFNEQGGDPNTPDDRIDSQIGIIDYARGTLQFPNFTPFTLPDAVLAEYARIPGYTLNRESGTDLRATNLYTSVYTGANPADNDHHFDIVAKHSSTSSRFRLNALNIKEGSEQVTLDGAVLNRGTDYEIDYFSGEVTLKDAATRLNAQSNIQVTYEVDPLFGGGRTSLHGFNLQYELGLNKSLSTTWLLQSQPSPNRKPRLGEEPSRTWVGNVAAKMRFAPSVLTWIANLLPRVESDDASTVTLDSELAVSVPNPNTRGEAYLEDFESVDDSEDISLSREGWYWASLPAEYDLAQPNQRRMTTANRVLTRWYRPSEGNAVKRGHINPKLSETERNDVLTALQLHVDPGVDGWLANDYGGIMRGYSGPIDLTQAQFLEFWLNDNRGAPGTLPRTGTLHFDFGYINEDFYWPAGVGGVPIQGEFDEEDTDNNGVASEQEDVGLDRAPDGSEGGPFLPGQPSGEGNDTAGDNYRSDERLGAEVFPFINGTENNQRLDSEDLNRNTILDKADGYFTLELDLADPDTTEIITDIYRDYADYPDFIRESSEAGRSWRKYRIDLRRIQQRQSQDIGGYPAKDPDLSKIYFVRVWFENPGAAPTELARDLVFAEMRFLGNRWRADGLRNLANRRLDSAELCPDPSEPGALEDFRLGVVNNKDDANYAPPVFPDTRNNVAEKEQSLLFRYTALAPGHQGRARKDIPAPQGQDFSVYGELNYFWRAPLDSDRRLDRTQFGLEPYFWIGSDSTNYYEVNFQFAAADQAAPISDDGWVQVRLDLGELTNVKLTGGVPDTVRVGAERLAIRRGTVEDMESGRSYEVRVVGAPDLRRVRRYYAGVRYPSVADSSGCGAGPLLSGEVLFNEIRLRDVDRERGFAKRVAVNTTLAGLGDLGVVWSETDPAFRGLNAKTGSNVLRRDWEVRGSSRLDRFIPTLGLEIPFSVSQRQSLQLPRYRTNTDIELLDDVARQLEQSTSRASSYNFQIRRTKASRNKLLAYTWDHLGFSQSGSVSREDNPTQKLHRSSREDRYNYDLNLTSGFDMKLPLIGTTWRYLPNQLSLSSIWRRDDSYRTPMFLDSNGSSFGKATQRTLTNTGTHTGTLNYSPMRSLRGTYTVTSARDRVRPQWALGVNWGAEDTYSERLTLNYTPGLPFIRALQPDLSYTGSYTENRRVAARDVDNAWRPNQGVRNFNNDRDITTRWQMDLGGFLRKKLGGSQPSATRPRASAAEQRREQQRMDTRGRRSEEPALPRPVPGAQPGLADSTAAGHQGSGPTSGKGTAQPHQPPPFPPGTPEQPPFGEEQPIPEQPGDDQVPPQDDQQPPPEEPPPPEPEQQAQETPEPTLPQAQPTPADTTGGTTAPKLDPLAPLKGITRPFVLFAKEMQPIRGSYSVRNTSQFQYMWDRASSLYRFGVSDSPDLDPANPEKIQDPDAEPDHADSYGQNRQLQLSTQSKLSQNTTLDLSYQEQHNERTGSGRTTRDVTVQWPTATIKVSGLEKWRIFGDSFASSSVDVSYKRTKDVRGMTDTSYLPRHNTSISPRWTFRFKSELSGNLGITYSNDVSRANDKDQVSRRVGANLKLQKSFDAEGGLGFLRFGHKGLGTKIESTLDIGYDRTRNFRRYIDFDGSEKEDQPTGNSRLSVAPNFSYQFSRAVRAGLRLSYAKTKDLSSNVSTQSFGLGLNATLTF